MVLKWIARLIISTPANKKTSITFQRTFNSEDVARQFCMSDEFTSWRKSQIAKLAPYFIYDHTAVTCI